MCGIEKIILTDAECTFYPTNYSAKTITPNKSIKNVCKNLVFRRYPTVLIIMQYILELPNVPQWEFCLL